MGLKSRAPLPQPTRVMVASDVATFEWEVMPVIEVPRSRGLDAVAFGLHDVQVPND